jgi:hypothetical protein
MERFLAVLDLSAQSQAFLDDFSDAPFLSSQIQVVRLATVLSLPDAASGLSAPTPARDHEYERLTPHGVENKSSTKLPQKIAKFLV